MTKGTISTQQGRENTTTDTQETKTKETTETKTTKTAKTTKKDSHLWHQGALSGHRGTGLTCAPQPGTE